MPCFKQEKSLEFRSRRDTTNDRDPMAPKAVGPRAMRYHGLFGMAIASQHLIVDENWTPSSLQEQYTGMTNLLQRRIVYKRHEMRANLSGYLVESKRLKSQCVDGRIKLQKISHGNNAHKIRNFLIHHKDMQRLYQRMPIHLVADNINQRTFTMRKERDRLELHLFQLKHQYRELLLDRSEVENRIRYENAFVLKEATNSRTLQKKIENSNLRLTAIKTINTTYRKMLQVLRQDENFYEPILRSLDDDMKDQSNFIKHIIYLGKPAISKFKELERRFKLLEYKSRKNFHDKMQILASLKTVKHLGDVPPAKVMEMPSANHKRFVRDTESMAAMKKVLRTIEKTIKELKFKTLCSQAKEIYPRAKTQMENNEKLRRKIANHCQHRNMLEDKMNYATMLQNVLVNNLSEEEINRLQRIRELKQIVRESDEFEQKTLEYIKNRGDAFVMLRVSLWHLIEILRHIDRDPKMFRARYPNSYLKLPLLKFEMLNMFAAPPELYEENTEKIMGLLKRKVYKLAQRFRSKTDIDIARNKEEYHIAFIKTLTCYAPVEDEDGMAGENDLLMENKTIASVPGRKQIKAQSTRLIEEHAKQEIIN